MGMCDESREGEQREGDEKCGWYGRLE